MVIQVQNLSKTFEYYQKEIGLKSSVRNLFNRKTLYKEAVKDVSFEIEEGEFVAFLGPNGSGKTTTLKMLSGILHPTSGDATVLGFTPWERRKKYKLQFSIVMGQKNQLWPDLPANESLYINKCIYEIEDKDYHNTLGELAEMLDVKDLLKIQVRRLSLGERMKLELIASLLHKPRVLFLDEPTIGLDIISQKRIRDFLKYYNEQTKITVLLTSHYVNDIEALCKRTIIINQGSVVYNGELMRINEALNNKKIIKIKWLEPIEKEVLSQYGQIKSFNGNSAVLEVDKKDVQNCMKSLINDMQVLDFNIEDMPIEDSISSLY